MALRVLVICAVRVYRDGLRRMLESHPRIRTVGLAEDSAGAVATAESIRPDVVLIDATCQSRVGDMSALRSALPRAHLVALGLPEREQDVVAWAEAGMSGMTPPDASVDELVACMEAASKNELRCSARVAGALLRRIGSAAPLPRPSDPIGSLTPRESHLLELISRGMSNKEIARALEIELSTVKNHVHNILEKLQVRRRGEAAAILHETRKRVEPAHKTWTAQ